jgi:hypothetical protein
VADLGRQVLAEERVQQDDRRDARQPGWTARRAISSTTRISAAASRYCSTLPSSEPY